MDLKNLPSRYTQTSDEMGGSKNVSEAFKQAAPGASNSVEKEEKTPPSKPGFLTWKNDDEPFFKISGRAKITAQGLDLSKALQQKMESGVQKQGPSVQEFLKQGASTTELPNVEPLVVEKAEDDDEKKTELAGFDFSNPRLALASLAVGVVAGWFLRTWFS